MLGHRFRRQHPIGHYIADFACVPARLIVEVDGATHSSVSDLEHDRIRDVYLRSKGWRVVRVWNHEIYKNFTGVLEGIARHLPPPPPSAAPPPQAGEENRGAGFQSVKVT